MDRGDSDYPSDSGGIDDEDETDYSKETPTQQPGDKWGRLFTLIPFIQKEQLAGNGQSQAVKDAIAELYTICYPTLYSVAFGGLTGVTYPIEDLRYLAESLALEQITEFVVTQLLNGSFKFEDAHKAMGFLCQGVRWAAEKARKPICRVVSLEDLLRHGRGPVVEDANLSRVELKQLPLARLMKQAKLTPREVKVILYTYFDDRRTKEIAERIHTTPEQVRHIRSRAVHKLRKVISKDGQDGWRIMGL
ncbi:MAG TPA: sigma-70 family RNA polymerase sigma factor [Chloroflexia bacterium]|nr:sigma-70 family RNA polymerase sigma factor [Chloroflexia bacterium]